MISHHLLRAVDIRIGVIVPAAMPVRDQSASTIPGYEMFVPVRAGHTVRTYTEAVKPVVRPDIRAVRR